MQAFAVLLIIAVKNQFVNERNRVSVFLIKALGFIEFSEDNSAVFC
jgi:hypothetical protein